MVTKKSQRSEVRSQKFKTTAAAVKKPAIKKISASKSQVTEKKVLSKIKFLAPVYKYQKQIVLFFIGLGILGLLYLFTHWFVIAWVDKIPVTRLKFYSELDKRYGSQIKEQLITQQLVLNEAKNKGVTVSGDELSKEYKKIQDQVGADMLVNLLAQQNISDSDFREQLKLQILVRKIFGQGVTVSDDEVSKILAQSGQASDSAKPVDQKQKDQAKEQLTNQKISQNFQSWLQNAQKSNRVAKF